MEKLNVTQLSKAFSVSKTSIRNWIDRGCPHTKTDKGHEFILSDVIKWHQGRYLKSVQPDEFQKSKATREHFKALLTELEYKERSGELISAQDVKEMAFTNARLTRDSILNIPNRISALLVNQTREKMKSVQIEEQTVLWLEYLHLMNRIKVLMKDAIVKKQEISFYESLAGDELCQN